MVTPPATQLQLTADERELIDEIDQEIQQLQAQRNVALTLALRTRKIREGKWDSVAGTGLLTRLDGKVEAAAGQVALPDLVQRALSARQANNAELAIKLVDEAMGGGNRDPLLYATKAACLGDLERRREAIQICDEGLTACPNDADGLRHERGFQRILSGDLKGWPDWEYRPQRKEIAQSIRRIWPGLKEWDGSANKMVLVCAEKGLGDTILFARYLSILRERSCTIQFLASVASAPMAALLKDAPGIYGSYSGEDQIPTVSENWITLESLPLFSDGIPEPFCFPSLFWEPAVRKGRKFRVGLCWHGHPVYAASKNRRPENLKLWEPVTSVKGVEFVSLQLGEQGPCAVAMPAGNTLAQTLETIRSCDLVISTDTSVVHMAASLGCPTWMPMHRLNYWPWIKDGERGTPWYAALRIFRQRGASGWEGVFERIARGLRSAVRGQNKG
jgi:hypothetical protein